MSLYDRYKSIKEWCCARIAKLWDALFNTIRYSQNLRSFFCYFLISPAVTIPASIFVFEKALPYLEKTFPQQTWLNASITVCGWALGLLAVFAIPVGLIGLYFTTRRAAVNIMAWRGYADRSILQKLPRGLEPTVIEYVRGVSKVETLRVNHQNVGVLVCDAEFLREHCQKGYLDPIRPKPRYEQHLEEPFHHFTDHMKHTRVSSDNPHSSVLGVPVRWAINDIVFNEPKAARAGIALENPTDYMDFNLTKLLNQMNGKHRIGLWNWAHQTFQTLLLCEMGLDVRHVHIPRDEGGRATMVDVERIARLIINNAHRFTLFDESNSVRQSLVSESGCWIVYGAGSWVLSLSQFEDDNLKRVVPNSGVTSWIECLAFPYRGLDSRSHRRCFVDAFLNTEMQIALCENPEYISAPVDSRAMSKMLARPTNKYMAYLREKGIICGDDIAPDKFIPRQLPKDWHLWEGLWRKVVEAIRSANS